MGGEKMIFLFLIFNIISAKIVVEDYRLSIFVQDRYVRSEVAVHVKNTGTESEEYDIGVNLGEDEFISSLTMRVGDKVTHGNVHEKKEAKEIYDEAKERGEHAGLTTESETKDTSFSTKVNVPAGEDAYFWLTYEQQLTRSKSKYDYKTRLTLYGNVKNLDIIVKMKESKEIIDPKVTMGWMKMTKTVISGKEVSFKYTSKPTYTVLPGSVSYDVKLEYDVVRPTGHGGDILIRNGYFVHFISPDDMPPIPKNIIFVIDKSASMRGARMDKTREAFEYILNDLEVFDKFNIIQFDSSADKLFSSSRDAVGSVLERAKSKVKNINASGGANIYEALRTALKESPHPESEAGIIFLLSDGDTNEGVTNWNTIRENVLKENEDRFAIFTFAIGSGAPYDELEKLSIQNDGVARQIFTDSDVKDSVEDFYKTVATPLLWNMTVNYDNTKKSVMSAKKMFRGEELVVVGELEDHCMTPTPRIFGFCGTGIFPRTNLNNFNFLSRTRCHPRRTVLRTNIKTSNDPMENPSGTPTEIDLERMFAYIQIKRWLREIKGSPNAQEINSLKEKVIQSAVKHGFVTKYTSMVVEENESKFSDFKPVDIRERANKSNSMWNVINNLAIGAGNFGTPQLGLGVAGLAMQKQIPRSRHPVSLSSFSTLSGRPQLSRMSQTSASRHSRLPNRSTSGWQSIKNKLPFRRPLMSSTSRHSSLLQNRPTSVWQSFVQTSGPTLGATGLQSGTTASHFGGPHTGGLYERADKSNSMWNTINNLGIGAGNYLGTAQIGLGVAGLAMQNSQFIPSLPHDVDQLRYEQLLQIPTQTTLITTTTATTTTSTTLTTSALPLDPNVILQLYYVLNGKTNFDRTNEYLVKDNGNFLGV